MTAGELLLECTSPILRSAYAGLLRIYDQADRVGGTIVERIRTLDWSSSVRTASIELSQMLSANKGLGLRLIHSHLPTLMNDHRHGLLAIRRLIERAHANKKGKQTRALIHQVVVLGQQIALELEPSQNSCGWNTATKSQTVPSGRMICHHSNSPLAPSLRHH